MPTLEGAQQQGTHSTSAIGLLYHELLIRPLTLTRAGGIGKREFSKPAAARRHRVRTVTGGVGTVGVRTWTVGVRGAGPFTPALVGVRTVIVDWLDPLLAPAFFGWVETLALVPARTFLFGLFSWLPLSAFASAGAIKHVVPPLHGFLSGRGGGLSAVSRSRSLG
jgi:hypothetical protein